MCAVGNVQCPSNINTHIQTQWAFSVYVYQIYSLQIFDHTRGAVVEDTHPRFHTGGLKSLPHGWEVRLSTTQPLFTFLTQSVDTAQNIASFLASDYVL